jgi:LacI family transcriptional regulator
MSNATAVNPKRTAQGTSRPITAQHKSRQVALGVRELVRDLVPGDRLPSIAHLERHFGVSTGTVESAIRALREEGLLVARRGSGVFVADSATGNGQAASDTFTSARTETLAVIAPANMAFFRYCVETLTEQAAQRGRKVVCHYVPENEDPERWTADALHLEALGPSGFLVFSHRLACIASALRKRGHRTVLVGTLPLEAPLPEGVPCIYGDQEQGAFLAIQHLLNLGHRRIGCMERIFKSRRFRGAERAVQQVLGRTVNPADVLRPLPQTGDENPHVRAAMFQGEGALTALFTWTDSHALEMLHALDRLGLRVPQDVSLVSYDALPLGAHSRPPLTSVDGHVETQVSHALEVLESFTQGGHVPLIAVTPTLVRRESSDLAPESPLLDVLEPTQ